MIDKQYRERNPEKLREKNRRYREQIRKEVLGYYSNGAFKCACCGENHYEFLAIDHIRGGGKKHLQEIGGGGFMFYLWLKRNNYPSDYRVLCYNCNFAFGHYGYCPHQKV